MVDKGLLFLICKFCFIHNNLFSTHILVFKMVKKLIGYNIGIS